MTIINHNIILILLALISCKDKTPKSKFGCIKSIMDEAPNQVMSFSFSDNREFYRLMNIDSTKDTISLGYKKNLIFFKINGNNVFLDYVILSKKTNSKYARYIIYTGEALLKSYNENIKQFYIQWPNAEIDSLHVDYIQDNSRDNPCCCQYPLQSLTLNGKSFIFKEDFDKNGIYIFEK